MTHKEFGYAVNSSLDDLKYHALKFTRDPNDADDLLQETKLKAIANREKFRMGTNLKAWLFTIMRNSFISGYQKNKGEIPSLTLLITCILSTMINILPTILQKENL